jgi:hypothetical protein
MRKRRLIFFLLLFVSIGATAQKDHNIRVKLQSPYPELWEEIDFMNTDTFFSVWHSPSRQSRSSSIKDIPDGQYTVRIWSVFNNHFEQPFTVKRGAKLIFPLSDYYTWDTLHTSFFDRAQIGDSIRIYSISYEENRGIGNQYPGYCAVGKDTTGFIIRFRADTGLIKFRLSEEEIRHFKDIENSRPPHYSKKTNYFLDCNSRVFYAFRLGRLIKEVETSGRRGFIYTLFEKRTNQTE